MAAQAGLCLAWSETAEETFCRVIAQLYHRKLTKAIKKKVLDSQAPPRLPKRLRIYPFFCVQKKRKIRIQKQNCFAKIYKSVK